MQPSAVYRPTEEDVFVFESVDEVDGRDEESEVFVFAPFAERCETYADEASRWNRTRSASPGL